MLFITRRTILAFPLFLLAAFGPSANAGSIVIGTNNFGNFIPFFGGYGGGVEYQELYGAAAFSGPIAITSIGFASAGTGSGTDNVTISLSTTSATLASPSGTFSANRGADFTQVFSGPISLTAANNGSFDLIFSTSVFNYDPSQGNLLLDVIINTSTGGIPFESGSNSQVSRVYQGSAGPTGNPSAGNGLVTQFGTGTPEPGSLWLEASAAFAIFSAHRLSRNIGLHCAPTSAR